MRRGILSAAVLLSLTVSCSAVVITDTFDTLDRQFWNTHLYLSTLTADPVIDAGSVLCMRQSAALAHDFGMNMYGSVSFDILCPASEPKQRVSLMFGQESLRADPVGFFNPLTRGIYTFSYSSSTGDSDMNSTLLLDMTRWHTYTMIFDETATSAYIDDILLGSSSYGGGFNTLYVNANIYGSSGFIDNFRYSSVMDYPSAVPEPASLALALLGLGTLLVRKFRKQ